MALVTDNIQDFVAQVKRPESTPEKPTPSLKGVDFFKDTHAKGFVIGKNPTDSDFILDGFPRLKDVDFFQNTYAKGFVLRKNSKDSDFILDSLPKSNFLDSRGNVSLPFNENNTIQAVINSGKSRLLDLHNDDNFLNDYYSQITTKGRLGIRNDGVNQIGLEQPFVVREIGSKLGFDGVEDIPGLQNNTIAKVLDFTGNILNDIGGAVFGRNPNEYLGAGANSLTRTAKFLATSKGAAFLIKQNTLIKRNPQHLRADVRYNLIGDESVENLGDLAKRTQNLQKYNPLSIGSLPGVTRIPIYALDPNQEVTRYLDTIAARISATAIKASKEVLDEVIDIGSRIGGSVSGYLRNTRAGKLFNDKIVSPVTEGIDDLKTKTKRIDDKRKAIAQRFDVYKQNSSALLSKESFNVIDPQAAANVGVDKVNLIPYGTRDEAKQKGSDKTEERLDFIPFRFRDVNNDKYIVFRAILSGITDTFSPDYSPERYVGRPDNVYVYQGTTREISFTLDIYPKSDQELVPLWEKMNYLAGLTYPHVANASGGGKGMISPICELTIGDMYRDTPGYIGGLSYTVQESSTWETTFAKLPKYIQAAVTFVYIGKDELTAEAKHFDVPWVASKKYISDLRNIRSQQGSDVSQTFEQLTERFKKKLPFN
jgi:hypothetical protein